MPSYVARDIDDELREALVRGVQQCAFVVLVGTSSVGKSRTLYEAVRAVMPNWSLFQPHDASEIRTVAYEGAGQTVVWLDNLERFVGGSDGLDPATVRKLLDPTRPTIVACTMWPENLARLTLAGSEARELLDIAQVFSVEAELSRAERHRAEMTAEWDPRIRRALGLPEYGLTQTLAAVPQLALHWTQAPPYAAAIIAAAVDARRFGVLAPIDRAFIEVAAPGYLTAAQRAHAPASWLESGLEYATSVLHGAASILTPVDGGMGTTAGYDIADYLVQAGSLKRRALIPPSTFWQALLEHAPLTHLDTRRLAENCRRRHLNCLAIRLYRRLADGGDPYGSRVLAHLLVRQGDTGPAADILRTWTDFDDWRSSVDLANLLGQLEEIEELRVRADAGGPNAISFAANLATTLARRGDLDALRERATAGDGPAAEHLNALLRADGNIEELRLRADQGDPSAQWELAEILAVEEDIEALHVRAHAGEFAAARKYIALLEKNAMLDELRDWKRTHPQDMDATNALLVLLKQYGRIEELQEWAATGDSRARAALVSALTAVGRAADAMEVLKASAESSNEESSADYANLLQRHGDKIELEQRAATDPFAAAALADSLLSDVDADAQEPMQTLRDMVTAGNRAAEILLTDLLAKHQLTSELQMLAAAGHTAAQTKLVEWLTRQQDLPQLLMLSESEGFDVLRPIANVLQTQGNVAELQIEVFAGNPHAMPALVGLFKQSGGELHAERIQKFGLSQDGSIATSPCALTPLRAG